MELPKFSVEYVDGTSFIGESLTGDWHKVAELQIKKMTFSFSNISLQLEDFVEYNHLVEKEAKLGGAVGVSKFIIMARLVQTTHVYEFNLKTKKSGRNIVPVGHEWGAWGIIDGKKVFTPQIITGWRKGVIGGTPRFKHGSF